MIQGVIREPIPRMTRMILGAIRDETLGAIQEEPVETRGMTAGLRIKIAAMMRVAGIGATTGLTAGAMEEVTIAVTAEVTVALTEREKVVAPLAAIVEVAPIGEVVVMDAPMPVLTHALMHAMSEVTPAIGEAIQE